MRNNVTYHDITHTILAVLWVGALIVAVFWIIKPFLLAMVWASMLVVATWPLLISAEKLLWGRRWLAAAAMTALLALVVVVPLIAALGIIAADASRIVAWMESMSSISLPLPPHWLETLPVIGAKLSLLWREVAEAGTAGLSERVTPYVGEIVPWFLSQAGNLGKLTFDFVLTVIITGVLYFTGDKVAYGVLRFARRLAGERGENVAILASKSVRGVALGVVVTAVLQSVAGGIGLAIAGVPAAALLTAAMFIFCLAQIGPSVVLVPAVVWLFWIDSTAWGLFLTVWIIFVIPMDSFLRPMLIRKSADLSLFLIFPGVIGGLMTLGIIGIFIGPMVLAVTYSLLVAWIEEGEKHDSEK